MGVETALNAYLAGMDRAEFEKAARFDIELWFWESPENIRLLNSPAPARDIASGLAQSKTIMDSGSRCC